ncbi:MAG TPA: hypothetical protein VH079_06125 [Terriglobales bacterium]|jgi:hypothetical protein|nr:hypothetical protein [Terriglobales bacterium]
MTIRKINVRTPGVVAWWGMTANIVAPTAKRSRPILRSPANAGIRSVPARLIERSDHDNHIYGGKLKSVKFMAFRILQVADSENIRAHVRSSIEQNTDLIVCGEAAKPRS